MVIHSIINILANNYLPLVPRNNNNRQFCYHNINVTPLQYYNNILCNEPIMIASNARVQC